MSSLSSSLPMVASQSVPSQWRQILRQNFTDIDKLANYLQFSDEQRAQILLRPRFVLNLPFRIAEKIQKSSLDDPLLKQFLPTVAENVSALGFVKDPVGDSCSQKTQKLLHKYQGRVLLVCSGACAMHCRYCFRQNYEYETNRKDFDEELESIAADDTLNEVILSGGDPLSLDDRVLKGLLDRLSSIPHLQKLRFHTRFPIGIPERLDDSFLAMLQDCRLQTWFVIHVNHPRELDAHILASLKRIQRLGIPVLSQSVLLKGVNDDPQVLIELSHRLVDHGIIPYYLHQLDRVQGAMHYEVSEARGKELIEIMTASLPGYAVPKYVRETAGMQSKSIVR